MEKYECVCGYVMNLSKGWSNFELTLIPDSKIEEVAGILESKVTMAVEEFYRVMDDAGTTVYRRPDCDRLHLGSSKNCFSIYKKEDLV